MNQKQMLQLSLLSIPVVRIYSVAFKRFFIVVFFRFTHCILMLCEVIQSTSQNDAARAGKSLFDFLLVSGLFIIFKFQTFKFSPVFMIPGTSWFSPMTGSRYTEIKLGVLMNTLISTSKCLCYFDLTWLCLSSCQFLNF